MRNSTLAIAIAFVVAAPCTTLAQTPSLNFQKIEHEYKPQKDDGTAARDPQSGLLTGQRMHKPLTATKPIGPASPTLTTQNKLQGNDLQKSVGGQVKGGYDLKANRKF